MHNCKSDKGQDKSRLWPLGTIWTVVPVTKCGEMLKLGVVEVDDPTDAM